MPTPTNAGGGVTPPKQEAPSPATPSPGRAWYVDEIVVASFAFLGFGGAVFLPLHFGFNNVPPIVVSFLLATGLAALTYRYLGGIPGTSLTIGALKLGGTLAALVGIALLINNQLVPEVQPAQVWDLYGNVALGDKGAADQLQDADFAIFPANASPAPNGDFHLRFIFDPGNPPYVTIRHGNYGPVTIPLEPGKLKTFDPDFKRQGNLINISHPVVLPNSGIQGDYKDASPAKPADAAQLAAYSAATASQPSDQGSK